MGGRLGLDDWRAASGCDPGLWAAGVSPSGSGAASYCSTREDGGDKRCEADGDPG